MTWVRSDDDKNSPRYAWWFAGALVVLLFAIRGK